jgi:glycosyltransferase involved in cell wall biosynthesis
MPPRTNGAPSERVGACWGQTPRPELSIIIPARNEEASLARCLSSLTADPFWSDPEESWRLEIIVVNDESSDCTRKIAESFGRVRVLDAGPLPGGWCGKQHACQIGADAATGEWLLFTDADTMHRSGGVWVAVAEARDKVADLLSYSPAQEVHGFAERSVMPLIYAELAAAYKPKQVSDPTSPAAAANGQFLLIRRVVYDLIGGHASVAGGLLEDVAIARRVKQAGGKLYFRFGGELVTTRMYRGWRQMNEGWTKNLALLFPKPRVVAAKRALEFLRSTVALIVCLAAAMAGSFAISAVAGIAAFAAFYEFFRRVLRAHFDWTSTFLFAPLGAPLFVYLLLRSERLHRHGGLIAWKGRQYGGTSATSVVEASRGLGTARVPERLFDNKDHRSV